MIIDNLKARCVYQVAREMSRSRGSTYDEWIAAIDRNLTGAAEKIDAMSNMELLDLIADVLACD